MDRLKPRKMIDQQLVPNGDVIVQNPTSSVNFENELRSGKLNAFREPHPPFR